MSFSVPSFEQHQSDICVTCLSENGDKLHPFAQDIRIVLKHLLHDFDLDDFLKCLPPDKKKEFKLCPSCHKTLKDMVVFKETAYKSLNHLKNLWQDNLSNSAMPSTSQAQFETTMITPKVEVAIESDPLGIVKLEYSSPEPRKSVNIKKEIDDNDVFDTAMDSMKNHMESDEKYDIVKKEGIVSIDLVVPEVKPVNVKKGRNTKRAKVTKATRLTKVTKSAPKSKSKRVANPGTRSKKQNATAPAVPQYFGLSGGTLKPLLLQMPLITGTQSPSQVKFVNLISLSAGTSKLVPATQPVFAICPDGSAKPLNPPTPTKMPYQKPKKSDLKDQNSNSDCEPGIKRRCRKNDKDKKLSKQYPWYITIVTREQILRYREERLKDPNFIKATYKCICCGVHYKEKSRLLNHLKCCISQSKKELYYKEKSRSLNHLKCCISQSKENAEFPCFACTCSFESLEFYNMHFKYHTLGCHTFQCPTCEFTTTNIETLSNHDCPNKGLEQVKPKDPEMILTKSRRQYYCPKCDFVSIHSIGALRSHFQRFHKSDGQVTCPVCGRLYRNQFSCDKHMQLRHHEKKPIAFCTPCDLPFYNKSAYRSHMTTVKHASKDQFKFKCDECPRKFHLKERWEKHKKVHEAMVGEKTHVCPECGRGYYFERSLTIHMKSRHSGQEAVRNHICDVCGDAFAKKPTLIQHMARHSDARPYKCKFCSDTFKFNGALYTHMKLKHKYVKNKTEKAKRERDKKIKTEHEIETFDGHEQGIDSREHDIEIQDGRSMESQEYGRGREIMEYEQIMELQSYDSKSMES